MFRDTQTYTMNIKYVHTCAHTHMLMCIYTPTHPPTMTSTHTHAHTHTHTHTRTDIHTNTHAHTDRLIRKHVFQLPDTYSLFSFQLVIILLKLPLR